MTAPRPPGPYPAGTYILAVRPADKVILTSNHDQVWQEATIDRELLIFDEEQLRGDGRISWCRDNISYYRGHATEDCRRLRQGANLCRFAHVIPGPETNRLKYYEIVAARIAENLVMLSACADPKVGRNCEVSLVWLEFHTDHARQHAERKRLPSWCLTDRQEEPEPPPGDPQRRWCTNPNCKFAHIKRDRPVERRRILEALSRAGGQRYGPMPRRENTVLVTGLNLPLSEYQVQCLQMKAVTDGTPIRIAGVGDAKSSGVRIEFYARGEAERFVAQANNTHIGQFKIHVAMSLGPINETADTRFDPRLLEFARERERHSRPAGAGRSAAEGQWYYEERGTQRWLPFSPADCAQLSKSCGDGSPVRLEFSDVDVWCVSNTGLSMSPPAVPGEEPTEVRIRRGFPEGMHPAAALPQPDHGSDGWGGPSPNRSPRDSGTATAAGVADGQSSPTTIADDPFAYAVSDQWVDDLVGRFLSENILPDRAAQIVQCFRAQGACNMDDICEMWREVKTEDCDKKALQFFDAMDKLELKYLERKKLGRIVDQLQP
eukprot:TRINITY_DN1023_c0_g1_i1.p1 TRINITY_DN1023_c0_g1~~TRINITY_DN1023_c0_g1_i1.p1  ORF type:complete len:547 (+),score=119.31 TRINITY_DN1023_c0_g1_i1:219-1859(+)